MWYFRGESTLTAMGLSAIHILRILSGGIRILPSKDKIKIKYRKIDVINDLTAEIEYVKMNRYEKTPKLGLLDNSSHRLSLR